MAKIAREILNIPEKDKGSTMKNCKNCRRKRAKLSVKIGRRTFPLCLSCAIKKAAEATAAGKNVAMGRLVSFC